ncbi:MAG: STAS domain-containing protein [Bryobacteraceae bacterium]|jgi:anti-sigma B factor antagonist
MTHPSRQVGNITSVDLSGRITAGEGAGALRDTIHKLAAAGHVHFLLNLADLTYMDSALMGEMVAACTTVRKLGGDIKLVNPQPRITQLLEMTKLTAVFAIFANEDTASHSFPGPSAPV